jgi:hypothetical protein
MTVRHINRWEFGDENQPHFFSDDVGCVYGGVVQTESGREAYRYHETLTNPIAKRN